uniref:Serine/threonine-protein kinase RIO3 n=1 Tax=Tetranychus urticae TaxID=32264 RepID=T1JPM7_TETUR
MSCWDKRKIANGLSKDSSEINPATKDDKKGVNGTILINKTGEEDGDGDGGGRNRSENGDFGEVSFGEIMNEQYVSYLMEKEGLPGEKVDLSPDIVEKQVNGGDILVPMESLDLCALPIPADEESTDNDLLLAQLLQEEFDKEFNDHLESQGKDLTTKSESVAVAFCPSRRVPNDSTSESEADDATPGADDKYRDWDSFESAEKGSAAVTLGRKGFAKNAEGSYTTKHDPTVCGRRNACRVMDFDVAVKTGDGGGFDMKLNNNVFNALKVHSKKESKRAARLRQAKEKSTVEHVMDEKTRLLLYKLVNRGILDEVNGTISTGKESHVYHGIGGDPEKQITCGEVAIKVYKTTLNEFKNREAYIRDDHRFKDKFSRQNPRKTIHLWAEKEMHNLMRIKRAGIPCPEVVMLKDHILVMKFIGMGGKHAPSLKDAKLSLSQLTQAYNDVVQIMKKMYGKCELIHGDLSEYNLLWYLNKVWVIDVSQSVLTNHPFSLHFLSRDCLNITKFFEKCGLQEMKSSGELFYEITGKELEGDDLGDIDHLANILDYERDVEVLTYGVNTEVDNFNELFERSVLERENMANGKSIQPKQSEKNDKNHRGTTQYH